MKKVKVLIGRYYEILELYIQQKVELNYALGMLIGIEISLSTLGYETISKELRNERIKRDR